MAEFGGWLFGQKDVIAWWQECARAVLIFGYGLVLVRVLGRRVFGKWAALDIVVSIVVGSNLSRALTGNAPLFGTMAATTVMMGLHWVLAHGAARSRSLSRLIEGKPLDLARDGKLDPAALRRGAVSEHDLNEALREHGAERAEETRLMTLEPTGKITVVKAAK